LHRIGGVPLSKRFVYILRSDRDPAQFYTGVTSDIRARLVAHNEGRCRHTSTSRPWYLDVVVEFADERRAIMFERYLKSGSGCAFVKRHFPLAKPPTLPAHVLAFQQAGEKPEPLVHDVTPLPRHGPS
jgi:putative endonuclease